MNEDGLRFRFQDNALGGYNALLIVPIYLLLIHCCKEHVHRRSHPYELTKVLVWHNSLLSLVSFVLFMCMSIELWTMYSVSGAAGLFCDSSGQWVHKAIYKLYYMNYVLKYIELGDTLLLALRGKVLVSALVYGFT